MLDTRLRYAYAAVMHRKALLYNLLLALSLFIVLYLAVAWLQAEEEEEDLSRMRDVLPALLLVSQPVAARTS